MGPEFGGGPAFGVDDLESAGISLASLSAGLEEQGADVMELMRKRKCGKPTNTLLPDVYRIGGHVDLGYSVERSDDEAIACLADVIGEKIDPFKKEDALVA